MSHVVKSLGVLLLGLSLQFVGATSAYAETAKQVRCDRENPSDVVKDTVLEMKDEVNENRVDIDHDPQKLYAIVKKTVMPQVDMHQMSAMTLGLKWRSATPAQREAFVDAFGLLITRTYASALVRVSNYEVTTYPLRGSRWKSQSYVSVSGRVTNKTSGNSSNVIYYLRCEAGHWLIYDMAIEGVSFVKNFQSQFAEYNDIGTLLKKLDELNRADRS